LDDLRDLAIEKDLALEVLVLTCLTFLTTSRAE